MFANIWLVRFPMGIPHGFLINSLSLSLVYLEARDNFLNELKRFWVTDAAFKDLNERSVVDAVEELFGIRPPDETARVSGKKILDPFNGSEQSFAFAARPGIIDKSFVINWNKVIINKPVNHAIMDGGYRNDPFFIVAHSESTIGAMMIRPTVQLFMKFKKILLKIILELIKFRCWLLSRTKIQPALPKII